MSLRQDDYLEAQARYRESLDIRREMGYQLGIASSLRRLGDVAHSQGAYGEARALYSQSLAISREAGDKGGIADCLVSLGYLANQKGDDRTARALLRESLSLFQELGNRWYGIHACLGELAVVALAQGQAERAARLLGASEGLFGTIALPREGADRAAYEHQVASIRAALGEEVFAAAWAVGQAMTLEDAIRFALEEDGPSEDPE
jgi:tetratricopeptide (TPR) repeat protein